MTVYHTVFVFTCGTDALFDFLIELFHSHYSNLFWRLLWPLKRFVFLTEKARGKNRNLKQLFKKQWKLHTCHKNNLLLRAQITNALSLSLSASGKDSLPNNKWFFSQELSYSISPSVIATFFGLAQWKNCVTISMIFKFN